MSNTLKYLLSVLTIGIFIILAYGSSDGGIDSVDLNASVSFTGTQFVIKNNDNFDYKNARMVVNGDYVLKGCNLNAGETYTVGMLQFANRNGDRFGMMKKPQEFLISCDLSSGKNGFFYATWE